MKKVLTYLTNYKKECVFAPLFKMLEASFELLVPLVMASVIDIGIANGDKQYVIQRCIVLIFLGIIGLTCSITAQYFAAKAAVGFATGLRHALFSHIQSLSFTEMDTIGTSTLITRMTSDINQAQNGVNMFLRLFLRSPFIVLGAMVMAFTIDVKAALVFVITIPLLSLVVFGIMKTSMPLYKKVQQKLDSILRITRENLTGARVIRAFNKEEAEIENFRTHNEALTDEQLFVGKISALMNPLTYIIINIATVVLIYVGAIRVNTGHISQGEVVALVNYMSQILVELIKLANLIVTLTKATACINRIADVLTVSSSMEFVEAKETEQKKKGETEVAVEFKEVGLTYEGAAAEALSDISFAVKKGQTIGIIGGTGSGKSSLVNLIPRFYDATRGIVKINGKNVKEYTKKEIRNKVGMVLQKAVLFQGTIRENLEWGKENATEEEMWEALTISQSKEFVEKKEGQLDAFVEQGGKNLSGGQRQRLTIARALMKKPEILILDDSASALDFATDAALRKAIRGMKEKPTLFIVTQRASSILYADQIIVLEDGEMVGIGTHQDLLRNCKTYQEIYYSQYEEEERCDA
ncbi:MAG: ABC transporter ATP-binding protein [Lachnospiraceae bacterium]|nr:ABC transporter ATP-binding protein/permease [Lachnospiraceae bacterium]MDD6170186.1 ABC transporter ATP-binding protein [Lachnospiraceae bacterium]